MTHPRSAALGLPRARSTHHCHVVQNVTEDDEGGGEDDDGEGVSSGGAVRFVLVSLPPMRSARPHQAAALPGLGCLHDSALLSGRTARLNWEVERAATRPSLTLPQRPGRPFIYFSVIFDAASLV